MIKLKHISVCVCLIFIGSCHAQRKGKSLQGEERLSLNGNWRFHTLMGEGSNYLDVKPQPNDILIDNKQSELLEVNGKWEFETEAMRESVCWDGSYLKHDFHEGSDSAYVRFKSIVPKSGYYEHIIFYPWGHHNASIINVKHANGLFSMPFNQRNRSGVWLSLGVFKVDKNSGHYIEFTSISKGSVVADAVILRPVDEKVYLAAMNEKKELVETAYDDQHWQTLKVPGHWGMINKYANYSGKGWYRTEINLPDHWKQDSDRHVRLRFEGVYHVANVYINGHHLGRHQGGFTPFEFDVTDKLDYSGRNVIAVEADNNYTVGATWNWGGIIRDVTLIKNKDQRIKYQYIHAEPNLETGAADYKIQGRVENNSDKKRSLNVEAVIVKDQPIDTIATDIMVEPNSIKAFELKGHLTADQVKLWHFDRPELYYLETSIKENGTTYHKKIDRFGIRKFEATNTQMFLNGEPVRLVGFNRVSDHRYWGSSEPQELIDLDVDIMKAAGANFMRIMHGVQNKKLLERCDEKGILIFEEANIRDIRNPQFTAPEFGFAKQWIREMIERDSNHPSIVGWSTANEISDHWDYVKATYEYAKKLDPYRMALHVSNQGYKKGENANNNPLNYGDMIFQNIYQKDPGMVMDTLRKRWPDKAMFIAEFGWAELSRFANDGLDNDFEELGTWYDYFRGQRPYITGASIWTYNDYRSGYTQSLPCENRAWGMVNTWRTKRRAFYTHLEENSPAKDLQLEDIDLEKQRASVAITIRDANNFPSFTMKEYSLKYAFRDISGNVLSENEIDLPVLSPGMGKWEGTLSWEAFGGKAFELQVALITTNGYTRREKKIHFDVPGRPKIDEVKTSGKKVRVHFTKSFDAFEYKVNYVINGIKKESHKTIANYIDLDSLPTGTDISLQLVAYNSMGASQASEGIEVKTEDRPLAPIVWDGFIADNKLVAGYSGTWEDELYTMRYGSSADQLSKEESANTRGMMTIPLNGERKVFFQIKRTTENGESQWSNTIEAKEGQFRIYD